MQTADCLRTIVFRVRKQWDYYCHLLICICMLKTIVRSLRFTLTGPHKVFRNVVVTLYESRDKAIDTISPS